MKLSPRSKAFHFGAMFFCFCSLSIPSKANAPIDSLLASLFFEIEAGEIDSLALKASRILDTATSEEDSLQVYSQLGVKMYQLEYFEQAVSFLNGALVIDGNNMGLNYYKGFSLDVLGKRQEATDFYEKAISLSQRAGENRILFLEALASEFLGKIYTKWGDFDKAIDYYHEAARLYQELENSNGLHPKYRTGIATQYTEMGTAYNYKYNQDTAFHYYQKAHAIPDIDDESKGVALIGVADYFLEKEQYATALSQAYGALSIFQKQTTYFKNEQDFQQVHKYQGQQAKSLRTIGQIKLEADDIEAATKAFHDAIKLGEQAGQGIEARELAKTQIALAQLYEKTEQYDLAMAHYHTALKEVLPAFQSNEINTLPNPDEFYPEWEILDGLEGKATIFREAYQIKKDIEQLKQALRCYELGTIVEDDLRQSYDFESSKLIIADGNHRRAADAVETAYLLYEASGEEKYIEAAFRFAERNKAGVLLESVSDLTARYQAGIPDSLLEKERDLQEKTIDLEMEVQQLYRAGASPAELEKATQQRFQARRQHQQLKAQLAQDFPEYYELKYQTETPSIEMVRSTLLVSSEHAFVEYFLGDAYLFVFVISKQHVEFLCLPRDSSWSQAIPDLLTGIKSMEDAAQEMYPESALKLYKTLIKPLDLQGITHLTIAPDRELAFVPFDALLTGEPTNTNNFSTYPYLIKDYVISYAYSAGMRLHTHTRAGARPAPVSSFLGMAPVSFQRPGLGALPNTAKEVQSLHTQFGGQVLLEDSATKDRFIQLAEGSRVIHLATHALGWDDELKTSWIAFAGEDSVCLLTLPELYALRLRAEMVVLGACETGTGALRRGEGIMSLARGMTYAGSQSTLMSLWSVRAAAAGDILATFYQNLQKGLPKDEALRNAKLTYFSGENASVSQGHPVMWAALVAIGDMEPLEDQKGGWMLWAIGLLLVICLLGWWVKKKLL